MTKSLAARPSVVTRGLVPIRVTISVQNTLDYACKCGNGTAPGLQYYTMTMPTYICDESYRLCHGAAGGDAESEKACDEDIKSQCGTLDQSTLGQKEDSDATKTAGSTTTGGGAASTTPSATDASSEPPNESNPDGDESSESKSPGTKIGIAVAGFVCGSLVLAGVAYVFYRRGRNNNNGRADAKHGSRLSDPARPFEKLDSDGDGWSSYELDTTTTTQRPAEMPVPPSPAAFRRSRPEVAELDSPKVFVAELDDTSLYRDGPKTVSEREDGKFRM
ncbi:hypothetical protein SLS62_001329 [Diatrype stigma]|uniref:DUF7707 domain-containing protein n=1 Tax=Diatrype stigma TaxID=117547 RepID=A0AAN9UW06_9PEZI